MVDDFDDVEFTGPNGQREPHEFIETAHDPDVLYHSIKNAEAKLEDRVVVDADGKDAAVAVHEKVDIFQSVMQYVEAFSVYYLAYLQGQEELLHHLTSTEPKDVKRFYKKLHRGRVNEFLRNNDIEQDYRQFLELRFGYQHVRGSVERGEEEPEEIIPDGSPYETIDELIENSADRIDSDIRQIGKFYRDFSDFYNAVKHGNRVIPQTERQYEVSSDGDNDSDDVVAELTYEAAMFVCRGSGEQNDYFAIIPTEYLLSQSLSVLETAHNLFSYLRDIAKVEVKEEWEFSVPFHQPTEEQHRDGEEVQEWAMVQNKNTISIVPRTNELSQLMPSDEEASWSFAATLHQDGNKMVIRSGGDTERSEAYPILFTIRKSSYGLDPRPSSTISMDIDIGRLDVQQYLDLLELKDAVEAGKVRKAVLYSDDRGAGLPMGPLTSALDLSSLPELFDREYLEQLAILQQITDPRIPVPEHLFDPDKETIERWLGSERNTEDAEEAVESLGKWEEREVTVVHVDLLNIYKWKMASSCVGVIPGGMNIDLNFKTEEDEEWFEEKRDKRETLPFQADGYDGTYEELVEKLTEDPTRVSTVLEDLSVFDSAIPDVVVEFSEDDAGFWGIEHELRLKLIDYQHEIIHCPLCDNLTGNIKNHLTVCCDANVFGKATFTGMKNQQEWF